MVESLLVFAFREGEFLGCVIGSRTCHWSCRFN